MHHPNGATDHLVGFPFAQLAKVTNCPCADGGRRTIDVPRNKKGEYAAPETGWTVPGTLTYRGKRITGTIVFDDDGPRFYAWGKNQMVLGRWPGQDLAKELQPPAPLALFEVRHV